MRSGDLSEIATSQVKYERLGLDSEVGAVEVRLGYSIVAFDRIPKRNGACCIIPRPLVCFSSGDR